ncbi:MAG: Asp-tRNA(Asn)/Glu-tRNA(Gln) amidotransferase subunit GatC, partial [Candidatus Acidiferrales bacterium]
MLPIKDARKLATSKIHNFSGAVMKITQTDVLRVAQLAHLELSPEELETYRGQLDEILTYIGKLEEIDVSN